MMASWRTAARSAASTLASCGGSWRRRMAGGLCPPARRGQWEWCKSGCCLQRCVLGVACDALWGCCRAAWLLMP